MKQKDFVKFCSDVIKESRVKDLSIKPMKIDDIRDLGGPDSTLGVILFDKNTSIARIYDTEFLVNTISGKKKVHGFVADREIMISSTRGGPEDWDVQEITRNQNPGTVLMTCIVNVVQERISDYLDHLFEEVHYKEIEELEKSSVGGHF